MVDESSKRRRVQRVAQRRGTSQSLSDWGLKQFEEGKKTLRLDVFLAVLEVLEVLFELLKEDNIKIRSNEKDSKGNY
ncbi:MAG: hypothetical protein LBT73_00250 [Tannerellaceae bacterium]|jgi:hypothetical protein|nr:hypothetical protein [Tannerellaceae bacterium]